MEYLTNRITIDEKICNGKPTIRGKRITVQTILEFLTAGDSVEEILYQYPSLEKEDIQACRSFGARLKAAPRKTRTNYFALPKMINGAQKNGSL